MIEHDGTRRPLTTVTGHDVDEAPALAVAELERRFGRLMKAPPPN